MGRRKLVTKKSDVGSGFFDDHISAAKDAVKKHVDDLWAKHHKRLRAHLSATAKKLVVAKDKKGFVKSEVNKIKKAANAKAHAMTEQIHEQVKAKAHKTVAALKKKAVARVRKQICPEVGEGFFDDVWSKVKWGAQKLFGGAKKHMKQAVQQGTEQVKEAVRNAPANIKKHLEDNKEAYMEAGKTAAADVMQNGMQGVHNTIDKVKKAMVKKARTKVGCTPKGSGMRASGMRASGAKKTKKPKGKGMRARGLRARGLNDPRVRARGSGIRIIG
jgi:predicted nucleic acid-binding Zn ribbon protein